MGDFAILLRAGFDRWSAARMQLLTALVGVLGASFAMCTQSPDGAGTQMLVYFSVPGVSATVSVCTVCLEHSTAWILPFTSGGFLYIALVNVVPDLLEESSVRCVGRFY